MAKNINMTEGKPLRLLLQFAMPLMLGNVFQQMYTVTDTAVVGQGVGMTALAAIGTVDWTIWMVFSIAQGFAQGFSVRMSMKVGQRDIEGLKHTIAYSARLCIFITVLLVATAFAGLPLLLDLLNVSDELYPYSHLYASILFAGVPAVMFYNFSASVLRSIGNSSTPFIAMVISSVTNIVLDIIAVFVLKTGLVGAAVATIIAQLVSGFFCLRILIRSADTHFRASDMLAFDRPLGKELIRLGAPVAGLNLVISIGGIIVQSVVNRFDTSFIAGYAATNKLYGLLEIAALSFGNAVAVYAGQNMGCGNIRRIEKGVHAALILAIGTSIVVGVVMIIFGRSITGIFLNADTPEMLKAASDTAYTFLCVMSSMLPVLYLIYIYRNAIHGMGNTFLPMFSGIAESVCRVIVALIVATIGKPSGIFAAEVSAWVFAVAILVPAYYIQMSKLKKKTSV